MIICHCHLCDLDFTKTRKRGSFDTCKSCLNKLRIRDWKQKNHERRKELDYKYREKNKESINIRERKRYHTKLEESRMRCVSRMKKFRELSPEKARETRKRYYYNNREKEIQRVVERNAKYRTPKWANLDKISKIYSEARRISMETGIQHHVDHIIPIKGREVSGLHVESNLRIIPYMENISKSNKLIPAYAGGNA